jgi:hypothetical protein
MSLFGSWCLAYVVGGGVTSGAAEGRRGGEGALGILGRGKVVAVAGDGERVAQGRCRGETGTSRIST